MRLQELIQVLGLMGNKEQKETAADRRRLKDRRQVRYVPPRSMTPVEKEYYDQNKTLDGLYK